MWYTMLLIKSWRCIHQKDFEIHAWQCIAFFCPVEVWIAHSCFWNWPLKVEWSKDLKVQEVDKLNGVPHAALWDELILRAKRKPITSRKKEQQTSGLKCHSSLFAFFCLSQLNFFILFFYFITGVFQASLNLGLFPFLRFLFQLYTVLRGKGCLSRE